MRGRELAQIDFLSRPAGPHGRRGRNDASIRIDSAQGIGVPTLRAARMEEKIVKVPKNELLVTLGQAKPASAGGADLEKDLAIEQQGKKLDPGKTLLPTQLFDLLRRGKHRNGGRNLRIANFEQRAGARRFQHHLVAAPPQIREPRQDESVGVAELRRCGQ